MSSVPTSPPVATSAPPAPLIVHTWPVRDEPRERWVLLVVAIGAMAVVGGTTGSIGWTLATLVPLGISLWRFLVPMSYEINSSGIAEHVAGRTRRLPWRAIAHWRVAKRGVLLFTRRSGAAIDCFASLYVPWNEHREDLLELVRHYIGPPETQAAADHSSHSQM